MNDETNTLLDGDFERKYFFMVANLVPFMELSNPAFRLYGVLLAYFGMGGKGKPPGNRKLAEWSGLSLSTVTEKKRELERLGFIDLTERTTLNGIGHDIHLIDIIPACVDASRSRNVPLPERARRAQADILALAEARRSGADVSPADTYVSLTDTNVSQNRSHERIDQRLPSYEGSASAQASFLTAPGRAPRSAKPVAKTTVWQHAFNEAVEAAGLYVNMRDAREAFGELRALDPEPTSDEIREAVRLFLSTVTTSGGQVYFARLPGMLRTFRQKSARITLIQDDVTLDLL